MERPSLHRRPDDNVVNGKRSGSSERMMAAYQLIELVLFNQTCVHAHKIYSIDPTKFKY